jgi:hypothetical protein
MTSAGSTEPALLDHPVDHPDDPTGPSGSIWTDKAGNVSRLDPSGADQIDAEHQATDLVVLNVDTAYMHRRPFTASASPVGRVTLSLHGPIGELAAALRTLADALDQEQATSTVTYTATVEPQARGPAPGGPTGSWPSSPQPPSRSWWSCAVMRPR